PLRNEPFVTEQLFLDKIRQTLKVDEVEKHQAALVKRAALARTAEKNDGGSMATMGQLLLGRVGSKNPRLDAFLEGAPAVMRKWQEANGSWKATGQLFRQNRPGTEADEAITGWAIFGLASLDKKDPLISQTLEAALGYFQKTKPGKSHESLLVHLL